METSPARKQTALPIRVLAICGSLRAGSANAAVLRAAASLVPEGVIIATYGGLADLPHFNPDNDGEVATPSVAFFRQQLTAADGILISCPEYAHGVPGVMKNALDWLVRSGELVDKPVALISASPHATWALASLTETLTVMSARLVAEASITLPLTTNRIDEAALTGNVEITPMLRAAVAAFVLAIRAGAAKAAG
jgi:NAD(P)H-dependent FMN reductase